LQKAIKDGNMNNLNPLLTIAIPTYNRANFLAEALDSIIPQIPNDKSVEILVCSNASTDSTDVLVAQYMRDHDYIRYLKNDKNLGIDENIHRVISEARGRYTHLMSDDDLLMPDSFQNIISLISEYPGVDFFFLNVRGFKDVGGERSYFPDVFSMHENRMFHDPNQFIEYIWVYATFMSSFLFRTAAWNGIALRRNYIGTDIYLTYVLFEILAHNSMAVFSAHQSIGIRPQFSGNYRIFHAFAYQWGRLLLQKAPELGFERSTMRRIFKRTIRHDLTKRLIAIKSGKINSRITSRNIGEILFFTWKFPEAWFFLYPLLLIPSPLLYICRKLVRRGTR
jgi:glycosyltransferase involved in cell wall biosynthesis